MKLGLYQWIYKLGVAHERRRIKLLIAEHQREKPVASSMFDKDPEKQFEREQAVWHQVDETLRKLVEPKYSSHIREVSIPLDEDIT